MERCETGSADNCEAQWIERSRSGDREAFRLLYDAFKDRVYSFALYSLNGDAASAEDAAQEVFIRVFQNIGRFRGDSEFTTWLYRLTANACTDEFRRRKRCARWAALELPTTSSSDFSRVELTAAVRAALAELSLEQRNAVLLKYYEDLSYEEMAKALACSKGTVASRLNRGLRILANKLAFLRESEPERGPK